jgi:hypothetical protein
MVTVKFYALICIFCRYILCNWCFNTRVSTIFHQKMNFMMSSSSLMLSPAECWSGWPHCTSSWTVLNEMEHLFPSGASFGCLTTTFSHIAGRCLNQPSLVSTSTDPTHLDIQLHTIFVKLDGFTPNYKSVPFNSSILQLLLSGCAGIRTRGLALRWAFTTAGLGTLFCLLELTGWRVSHYQFPCRSSNQFPLL